MTMTSTECPILCNLVATSRSTGPPFLSQSMPMKPSLSGDQLPSHAVGAGTEASSMFAPVERLHVIGAPSRHADDEAGREVGLLLASQCLTLDPPPKLASVLLEVLVHRRVDVVAHRLADHLPRRKGLEVTHVFTDTAGRSPVGPQGLEVCAVAGSLNSEPPSIR